MRLNRLHLQQLHHPRLQHSAKYLQENEDFAFSVNKVVQRVLPAAVLLSLSHQLCSRPHLMVGTLENMRQKTALEQLAGVGF
jgi:hypothetical protein